LADLRGGEYSKCPPVAFNAGMETSPRRLTGQCHRQ